MALFGSKTSTAVASEVVNVKITSTVKYDKPKILLIDVESSALDTLAETGFNVKAGTFGQPYKVQMASGFQPLISDPLLPNHTEQEIVIVDLHYEVADQPVGKKKRPDGEVDLWGKCDCGFIDPRMRCAAMVRSDFDRILAAGGVFVVFAAAKTRGSIQAARKGYHGLEDQRPCNWSEWSFVSDLQDMDVSQSHGEEMNVVDQNTPLGKLIKSHLSGGSYDCTLSGGFRRADPWIALVKNKFNEAVALFRPHGPKGFVIVLPQLKGKTGFLNSLFTDVLPEMAPHLFPGIEQGRWTHLPDYELPEVVQLHAQRSQLEAKFQADLTALDEQVLQARKQDGWMHDLLTQTGDPLVAAVQMGLKTLGFKSVIDMDKVRDKEGKSRREDLQIQDVSPTLVVDVKGIASFPGDEDVLQANKHATLLMREQNRTDVFGLSLVNHQRHIPPMQRDNEMPFRQELLHVALESQLGLLTAWDFYRLVRNACLNQWKFEHVQPVLYQHGRFEIVPAHYSYLGKVTKVWKDKFGVDIESGAVAVGEGVAIEFSVLFEEADVAELMVNNNKVQVANVGDKTGIPWPTTKPKLREGLRVFHVAN
ncbi:hypothetical protein [Rhodoferax sp.]|uniref:hypothetical protein n=1 Tax=Rhodoferax sp. TaxID=50421 RepID=UPI002606D683|nr:hypothetical protein [Rhodoferax sp.]MDD2917502.1 hypothetical protein [Rhodoferax sp.]